MLLSISNFDSRMIRIEKVGHEDLAELTSVAKETFIQSHGHNANTADIQLYLDANNNVIFLKQKSISQMRPIGSCFIKTRWWATQKLYLINPRPMLKLKI